MPYLASSCACAAGEMAFSLRNGPPGTARITKKVMVMTTQTVNTARISLLTIYNAVLESTRKFLLP